VPILVKYLYFRDLYAFRDFAASHADVLRVLSRVSSSTRRGGGNAFVGEETRDETLRTSAWEARDFVTRFAFYF